MKGRKDGQMDGWMDVEDIDKWFLDVKDEGERIIPTMFFQKQLWAQI